ncbi:MAG: F0F1 ATP synthase subunit B, partial [Pseudomonadota bacterium]
GILLWQNVPKLIGGMLSKRADDVRTQLDEARTLREEAQRLLADYQKRQREAEDEAKSIIDQAKEDAKIMANDARTKLDEQLTRRRKAVEERIARAEAQAIAEMQGQTADLAIAAAREIITGRVDDRAQAALLDKSIADIRGKLN